MVLLGKYSHTVSRITKLPPVTQYCTSDEAKSTRVEIISWSRDGETYGDSQIDTPVRVSAYCRIEQVSGKVLSRRAQEVTHEIIPPTQNQDVPVYQADLQSFLRRRRGFWFWFRYFLGRLG